MENDYNYILFYRSDMPYDKYSCKIINDVVYANKDDISYGFLGNFHSSQVKIKISTTQNIFPTSENAFQASKCINSNDIEKFTKCSALSAFYTGHKIAIRSDWNDVKNIIMEKVIYNKFSQNEVLREKLLATGDAYLIEHTPVKNRDKYWADNKDGTGMNMLGKCLMNVRVRLGGLPAKHKSQDKLGVLYSQLKNHKMYK